MLKLTVFRSLIMLLLCGFSWAALAKPPYLEPGVNNYNDMLRLLGKPLSKQATPDGYNYLYDGVIVNISGPDQATILTVTYLKPNIYNKYLYLDVGLTASRIKENISDYYEHKEATYHFIADYERSVIFWFDKNQRVVKYVQALKGSLKRI